MTQQPSPIDVIRALEKSKRTLVQSFMKGDEIERPIEPRISELEMSLALLIDYVLKRDGHDPNV